MSIQSIIGGQAPALNVLSMIPPIFQRDVGLRPLLAHTLRLAKAESMSHQQDAVDGLPRRHRGRTACLGRIGSFSQILTSYVWNAPRAEPRPDTPDTFPDIPGHSGHLSGHLSGQDRTQLPDTTGHYRTQTGQDRTQTGQDDVRACPVADRTLRDTPDMSGHSAV